MFLSFQVCAKTAKLSKTERPGPDHVANLSEAIEAVQLGINVGKAAKDNAVNYQTLRR